MLSCARCGAESPDGFRFCPACGAALALEPAPRQARKVVTAVFCDMTGSTALGEQLDPEVLRGVINRCFAELRATIERHGGTVERFVGDAVMAVFGIPRVEEDDALRAVRAAAEIRERMPALGEEVGVALRFRTGVNTGPVLMGEGENLAEVRRLLESLARDRPVVWYVDDLQWAEPTLLDLVDHVSDLSRGAPILLLCTARPELLEDRPSWGGGKFNATTALLEPLATAESEALLDKLADGLDAEARARVIAASEGNPLFLEEMVGLARERGTVEVPPTIQALLAARLEGLEVQERELLERGAVEGEVFHRLAVHALADERLVAEVELRLSRLVRKELIRPHVPTLIGDEAFRFRHLLIRDAAYDGLPKAARAELHERFARWLEGAAQGLVELDEIAGWHLEQAVRYRRELGQPVDRRLAGSAAAHLHLAGTQARMRADLTAARNLLERALALAPDDGGLRARIAVDLADDLIVAGEVTRVDELLADAERDPDVKGRAALIRLKWLVHARPREAIRAIDARLPGLLVQFAADGDERGLAMAHKLAFERHWLASRAVAAAQELRLTVEHAERVGDQGLRSRALGEYVSTLMYGPTPVRDIEAELDRVEELAHGVYVDAFVAAARSAVAQLDGRFEEARVWARREIDAFASIRDVLEAWGWEFLAEAETADGDLDAALEARERGDAIQVRFQEQAYRSTSQAMLADLHVRRGDLDSARAAISLSDELTAPEDVLNYALTHRLRAQLALVDGDVAEAERWARSAVHYAFLTDFPVTQADAKLALARVLSTLDRVEEARTEARAAVELYDSKGDRPGLAVARAVLATL